MIHPLGKYVLVSQNMQDKVTSSGIVLASSSSTGESRTGTVIDVGPDVRNVTEGEEVYVKWDKATVIAKDREYLALVEEEFIIATVRR